jgi:ribonuclease HII
VSGPDWSFEAHCPSPVCGIDEAGRGPWAGPVTAAAVILNPADMPVGLNDSKKLSEKARDRLEIEIKARALAWAVGEASAEEICDLNIIQATGLAMRRAVAGLKVVPVFALVDGNYGFDLPCPVRSVVKGDGRSLSIAAASILAKVARDRVMMALDRLHPGYGFAAHKGYGVPAHAAALQRLGPCPAHRLTWGPIVALSQR